MKLTNNKGKISKETSIRKSQEKREVSILFLSLEIFTHIDSQLPLRFYAAAFASVFASYQWGESKERAF